MTGNFQQSWRFVYWFWEQPEQLRGIVKGAGCKCTLLRDLPCAALRRNTPVIVVPEAWDKTCARQGSWYRASDKNGAVLLVSPVFLNRIFENSAVRGGLAAILDLEPFTPKANARTEQIDKLLEDRVFRKLVPLEWFQVNKRQESTHVALAVRFGATVTSWSALFAIQTANHANFISPGLTATLNGEPVPCSIYPTAYLCSCCLQLFRVMETGRKQLLVAPCPGGVIYGQLTPDRYIRVRNHLQFEKPA